MGMFMFDIFPIIWLIFFIIIVGMFVVILVKNIGTWNKNNNSPRLAVNATVVSKRGQMRRHGTDNMHVSTSYYATFQFESGDRLELAVPSSEYGMLVEGDNGTLTFQGTRYLSFERIY